MPAVYTVELDQAATPEQEPPVAPGDDADVVGEEDEPPEHALTAKRV